MALSKKGVLLIRHARMLLSGIQVGDWLFASTDLLIPAMPYPGPAGAWRRAGAKARGNDVIDALTKCHWAFVAEAS